MKRRVFLKKSAVAASLVSIPGSLLPLTSCKESPRKRHSGSMGAAQEEIRSTHYLQCVQSEEYLPKPVVYRQSYQLSPDLQISPMSLVERIRQKIVPRQGFCSLAPGGDTLLSGNGAVNIEVAGNPYTEQIPFSHESLFTPRKKSSETSKIADVFPKVRQMMLDGKYHEAVMLAYNEWQKNPVRRGMGGFGGGRFSMLLEIPGRASVRNYLRTVDFESTEVKIHWSDEQGDWVRSAEIANRRRTFDTMSTAVAGETLASYARCHRALVGARLKDNIIVDTQLRQLIEQGQVSTALQCSRETYGVPIPDAQGGIPAIIMEMLAYSRPGIIEVLPALPPTLVKGTINGMLARTCARLDKLTWDMQERTVDITITSLNNQDITLIARYGIEDISAPSGILGRFRKGNADCGLHLPENEPVEIHLELGQFKPLDWVAQVT